METNSITISNYETWMVDYWDGNLDPAEKAMLMRFLDEHPQIKTDFLDAGHYTLPDETIYFDSKEDLLKKEVSRENIDEFLVAELENDILPHELNELHLFIASNPAYKRDRALYSLTKLTPDKNLVYPDKRSLKRGVVQPLWIRYSGVAAAACVFFALGIGWFNRTVNIETAHSLKYYSLPGGDASTIKPPTLDNSPGLNMPIRVTSASNHENQNSVRKEVVSNTHTSQTEVTPVSIKDEEAENFYSYSKNRRAEDYLNGLVNSYLPEETIYLPASTDISNATNPISPPVVKPNAKAVVNNIATKSLVNLIKDSALSVELKNEKYSVKTKVATAIAWATRKASGGKVKAIAIPNLDGSLAALSFTNGKYNYTKRF